MRVVDMARELGVSASWLRRLEREGRIPKATRDVNGHRRYGPEDAEQLRLVILGKSAAKN